MANEVEIASNEIKIYNNKECKYEAAKAINEITTTTITTSL